jgi:fumarate reductase subunit D
MEERPKESLKSMLRNFYSLGHVAAFAWFMGVIFLVLTVIFAVMFFRVASTREQIMYATLFLTGMMMLALMKIFAWQMMHRTAIRRDLRRIADRLAALERGGNGPRA